MPEAEDGYKCSSCGETFSKSTSAKKHVNFSKKCRSVDGTFSKVIPYKIVTSRSDRRVGGREIMHDQSNSSDVDHDVSNQNDSQQVAASEHDEILLAPAKGILLYKPSGDSTVTSSLQLCSM